MFGHAYAGFTMTAGEFERIFLVVQLVTFPSSDELVSSPATCVRNPLSSNALVGQLCLRRSLLVLEA